VHWRDTVVLGRWNERSGSLRQRLSIDRAGRAILRNESRFGPRWPALGSAAVMPIGTRVVGCDIDVAPRCGPGRPAAAGLDGDGAWAVNEMGDGVTVWTACAPSAPAFAGLRRRSARGPTPATDLGAEDLRCGTERAQMLGWGDSRPDG
jgi:hypothetical protein